MSIFEPKLRRMFRKLLLMLALTMSTQSSLFSQTVFYSDNFESTVSTWGVSGTTGANRWVISNCTANGGTKSAYITSGGSTMDCSSTGIEHYGYINAPAGTESSIVYQQINAGCYNGLTLKFDLKIDGNASEDYVEVVYSTNNGSTWNVIGAPLTAVPAYAQQTIALPASLNQTNFLLGFRFTYNNTSLFGNPPSVDNVTVEGTFGDTTNPVVVCPASITLYTQTQCKGVITDISAVATISENCTTLGNLIISQTPTVGSITLVDVAGTLTVEDEQGLIGTCNTQFILVDTMAPVVTCPASYSTGLNSGCAYTLTDLSGEVTALDQCSSTLIYSQNPAIGSVFAAGTYPVTIMAEDESGNVGNCVLQLIVSDTTAPVLNCPATVGVYANTLCNGEITNQVPNVSATDNCTASGSIIITQDLMVGYNFLGSTTLTMSAEDQNGNIGTCAIQFVIIDTIAPVVTCPDDTLISISAPCNYATPDLSAAYTAVEYCTDAGMLSFSQSPVAGSMASGPIDIVISITDTSGNIGTCITQVIPNDITAPGISCPTVQNFNNGVLCSTTLPDMTSLASVTDNCGFYTLSQSPVSGTVVNSGSNLVTITVTDINGNQNACFVFYDVIEFEDPQISCPPNVVACTPTVVYNSPIATDNCLFTMAQTDGTGFTSGDLFPIGITNQTYLVTDSSGNTATCTFTVHVLEYPDTAHVAADTIGLCEVFSTPILADAIQSGTGNWELISGTGTITDPTSNSTDISGLSLGTTKVVWKVSSPSCGQLRDTLTIIVSQPSSQAVLLDTMVVCYQNGSVVQGNIPTSGTGTWSSSSGVTFSNINAPIVQINNVNEGFGEIFWTIQSIGCAATIDSAVIFRPLIANVLTNDTTLCIEDFPFALTGSAIDYNQSVMWSIVDGTATLGLYTQPTAQLVSGLAGSVTLQYTASHLGCPSTSDQIVIELQNCEDAFFNISTIFTPNGDGKNDYFTLGNLHSLHPDAEVTIVNRWGNVVFESIGYANPWDGTFKGEPLPLGTYFYSIVSPKDAFEKLTGSISIIR
jgi:gliding motility-associated-like protein